MCTNHRFLIGIWSTLACGSLACNSTISIVSSDARTACLDGSSCGDKTAGEKVEDPNATPTAVVPTISLHSPADAAAEVPKNAEISITFAVAMAPTTINSTSFNLKRTIDGTPVTASVTYDTDSRVATLTPASELATANDYTVTVTTDVMTSAGATFPSDQSWTFITEDYEWDVPEFVENTSGDVYYPEIAVDQSGNAIAVYQQFDGATMNMWSNRYTPSGGWQTPELIESGGGDAYFPQIACDQFGNAIAVWNQSDGTRDNIYAARYIAGTGWQAEELIETSNAGYAYLPAIAVTPSGDAVAVWHQSDGTRYNIWANRYVVGSGWQTAELIESDNLGNAQSTQVVIDDEGNAMAVWSQSDGTLYNAWANRYVAGTGWQTAEMIEAYSGGSAGALKIAMDADGNVFAVFTLADAPLYNVWANRYVVGSGWQTEELIETNDVGYAQSLQIAVDAFGNATAIWAQRDGSRDDIWINRFVPNTGWGTPELIETDNTGTAGEPQIAFDPSGNGMAVWKQSDGINLNITFNRYIAGKGWQVPELIEANDSGHAQFAQIGLDPLGRAIVVWAQRDNDLFEDSLSANIFR